MPCYVARKDSFNEMSGQSDLYLVIRCAPERNGIWCIKIPFFCVQSSSSFLATLQWEITAILASDLHHIKLETMAEWMERRRGKPLTTKQAWKLMFFFLAFCYSLCFFLFVLSVCFHRLLFSSSSHPRRLINELKNCFIFCTIQLVVVFTTIQFLVQFF